MKDWNLYEGEYQELKDFLVNNVTRFREVGIIADGQREIVYWYPGHQVPVLTDFCNPIEWSTYGE